LSHYSAIFFLTIRIDGATRAQDERFGSALILPKNFGEGRLPAKSLYLQAEQVASARLDRIRHAPYIRLLYSMDRIGAEAPA
jgi:hypothetical protein